VTAVNTINRPLAERRGQAYIDPTDGSAWRRLRVSVECDRGIGLSNRPVYIPPPTPPRTSWFITEADVLNWDVLREELSGVLPLLGLVARRSPLEKPIPIRKAADLGLLSNDQLLACLNDALNTTRPESFSKDARLSPAARALLAPRPETGLMASAAAMGPKAEDGRRVMRNRLYLEAWLPDGLAREADVREPYRERAMESGLQRTALHRVAVFIKQGSASDRSDSEARIRLRHLGDGWITATDNPGGPLRVISIPWPASGFNTLRPRPESLQELQKIANNPLDEVNERVRQGRIPDKVLENGFSTFYPLMGTYELLIPEGRLNREFEYRIVLLGSSVEFAVGASRASDRR
jgi:hypothetical protein